MNNSEIDTVDRLLMMASQEPKNDGQKTNTPQHTEETNIPPIGIANPELIDSFMSNMGDPEKIKQDIKDVEEYQKENVLESGIREAKSYGLRALEGLGGSIGFLMNALSGEANFNDKGELIKTEVPMLPSTERLREFTKEKTGKKYEPKSEISKSVQELSTDIGANLPFPGNWAQKLITPMLGQGTKELFKNQGASEKTADLAKLGIMMSSTIANIGNAPQMASKAYNQAVNMIPQGTRMSTRYLQQEMNAIKNLSWFKTGRTTAKGPAMDEIKRIEDAVQHGSMDVHDAMQIRRDINEARNKLGAFNYEPGIDKKAARQYLDQIDDVLRTNLERYGQANNPNWLKNYQTANQAYAVTRRSQQLQDYIHAHPVGKALTSNTAKTLFHLGGASALAQAPQLIAGAVPLAAGAKGMQIINRMMRSPLLRNYYLEVLTQAAAQNAGAMQRALIKFDNEAQKEEKKGQKFSTSSSPSK